MQLPYPLIMLYNQTRLILEGKIDADLNLTEGQKDVMNQMNTPNSELNMKIMELIKPKNNGAE